MSAFGDKEEPTTIDVIKLLYQRLERGYNSMPLDLPGTLFHKSMKVYYIVYELYIYNVLYMKLMIDILGDEISKGICT